MAVPPTVMVVTVPPVTMTAAGKPLALAGAARLASPLPAGLLLLIRADYAASPVLRDLQ